MRKSPFGEWNIVYFDPKKTNSGKILKRLRENRCPKAELIQLPKSTHRVLTSIVTPGDGFQIRSHCDKAPQLGLPKGWVTLRQTQLEDRSWLSTVQTTKDTPTQRHTFTAAGTQLHIELVTRVH